MDFKNATKQLISGVTHQRLADALGRSLSSIRQALLADTSRAFRAPPQGWQRAIAKLAADEAKRLEGLASTMREAADDAERVQPVLIQVQILKGGIQDGNGGTFTVNSVVGVTPDAAHLMIGRGHAKLAGAEGD